MGRTRLDVELVNRGLVPTRSRGQRAVRDGLVLVDGAIAERPALGVDSSTAIEVAESVDQFVSRGAQKLEAALVRFRFAVAGRNAIDVGASTGGFTDALLQRGARSVMAVDVGHGQLHPGLREDPRVIVREGVNIRSVLAIELGAPFDVVVADLSFISLRLVAANLAALGDAESDWVLLVKPQFEVGAAEIGKGGVVRSPEARRKALQQVALSLADAGLTTVAAMSSPITGSAGNREALLWLRRGGERLPLLELIKVLDDE